MEHDRLWVGALEFKAVRACTQNIQIMCTRVALQFAVAQHRKGMLYTAITHHILPHRPHHTHTHLN
jgi:hypothetical protein